MDPVSLYIQQAITRAEREVDYARLKIAAARTMVEVVRAADIHIAPQVAAVRAPVRGLAGLRDFAQTALNSMLDEQLAHLREQASKEVGAGHDLAEVKQAHNQRVANLRSRHWHCLRGHFPILLYRIDRECGAIESEIARRAESFAPINSDGDLEMAQSTHGAQDSDVRRLRQGMRPA